MRYFSNYFVKFLTVVVIDGSIYLVALDYFKNMFKIFGKLLKYFKLLAKFLKVVLNLWGTGLNL